MVVYLLEPIIDDAPAAVDDQLMWWPDNDPKVEKCSADIVQDSCEIGGTTRRFSG